MGPGKGLRSEREPLAETAFYRVATDSDEGSLTDVGWALYFSVLAILVIADPVDWSLGATLTVMGLSAIVAVCRRRRIALSLGALLGRRGAGVAARSAPSGTQPVRRDGDHEDGDDCESAEGAEGGRAPESQIDERRALPLLPGERAPSKRQMTT